MRQSLLRTLLTCLTVPWLTSCDFATPPSTSEPTVSAIDRVWAGHRVDFAFLVSEAHVYIGYYDANRQLTVAERPRRKNYWTYFKLDSWLGWDSHNSVALGLDRDGHLHVAANMHGDPLNYFSTTQIGDVRSLRRVETMVEPRLEQHMTYPRFISGESGELFFSYRDGRSGSGNTIFNVYDEDARAWAPLHREPLIDGEGERNAYIEGPLQGPGGYFHLAWVWRDTNDAATNHSLSYARSADWLHWTGAADAPLDMPITFDSGEVVDPVPPGGGMINNNVKLGFDRSGRTLIAYHKFDNEGDTEIYLARREDEGWTIAQASNWDGFRWDFGGRGTLDFRVRVGRPRPADVPGHLILPVTRDGVHLELIIDEVTLDPLRQRHATTPTHWIADIVKPRTNLTLNVISTIAPGDQSACHAIAWSSAPPNRDSPLASIPDPTELYYAELTAAACGALSD